jgi:hypothetical protein
MVHTDLKLKSQHMFGTFPEVQAWQGVFGDLSLSSKMEDCLRVWRASHEALVFTPHAGIYHADGAD